MNLLNVKPVPRDPDDGVVATYECQACFRVDKTNIYAYSTPNRVRCWYCGYYEGDNEC